MDPRTKKPEGERGAAHHGGEARIGACKKQPPSVFSSRNNFRPGPHAMSSPILFGRLTPLDGRAPHHVPGIPPTTQGVKDG